MSLLPKSLYEFRRLPDFFWLIFVISLQMSPICKEMSLKLSLILPLSLIILTKIIKNALILRSQKESDRKFNGKKFAVYQEDKFSLLESENIVEGDIILLKPGEKNPAGGIILASENPSRIFYARSDDMKEDKDIEKKEAVKETQSFVTEDGMDISELKRHIDYIKVVKKITLSEKFEGKIKLKKDPRLIYNRSEQLLKEGSMIFETKWALLLIVYVSRDSKKPVNFEKKKRNSISKVDKMTRVIFTLSLSLIIILFTLNLLLGNFYNFLKYKDNLIDLAFYSIFLYSNLVPISLILCLNLQKAWQVLVFNYKNQQSQINNSKALEDLGKVEYILAEKKGVFADEDNYVHSCLINNTLYTTLKPDECRDEVYLSSFSGNEEFAVISQETGKNENEKPFEALKQDLKSEDNSEGKLLLIACLIICNNYASDSSFNTISGTDKALVEFCKSLGVILQTKSNKKIEFKVNSTVYTYTVLRFTGQEDSESVFFCIVTDDISKTDYLIHRLPYSEIEKNELIEASIFENVFDLETMMHIRKIAYLFKPLNEKESSKYKKKYKKMRKITSGKIIKNFNAFVPKVNKFNLLGVVGVDNYISPGTIKTFNTLRQSGIKIWITSCLSKESVLTSAYKVNLISNSTDLVEFPENISVKEALFILVSRLKENIEDKDENKGKKPSFEFNNEYIDSYPDSEKRPTNFRRKIHPLFTKIDKDVKNLEKLIISKKLNTNLAVYLNPEIIDLAYTSKDLMKYFIILMFTAKTVLVSSLGSEHKKKLVQLLRNNLDFRPVVMAVGKGKSCDAFIGEANIGVRVTKNLKKNSVKQDVCIRNFSDLEKLILKAGQQTGIKFRVILFLTFFKEVVIVTILFLYQSLCSFSASPMIDYDLLVIFEIFLSVLFVLSFACGNSVKSAVKYPEIYKESLEDENRTVISFILYGIFGVINGAVVFVFIIFAFPYISNQQGFTEDYESLGLTTFIIVFLALATHSFTVPYKKTKICLSLIISLAGIILVISLACNNYFGYSLISTSSFVHLPKLWLLMILVMGFTFVSSYIFWSFTTKFLEEIGNSRLTAYKTIDKVFRDKIKWKVLNEIEDFKMNTKKLEFIDKQIENEYLISLYSKSRVYLKWTFVLIFIFSVINVILVETGQESYIDIGKFSGIFIGVSFLAVLSSIYLIKNSAMIAFELIAVFSIVAITLFEQFINYECRVIMRFPVVMCMFSLIIFTGWSRSIAVAILVYLSSIVSILAKHYKFSSHDLPVLVSHWSIIMFFCFFLLLVFVYFQENFRRKEFIYIKQSEYQVEKFSTILSYLLPDFVSKRVKDGVRYIADDKGSVSVIFCDIYDFDTIAETYSANELIEFLNDVFKRIDMICEQYGACKIETVGKTYLACTGLKDDEAEIKSEILIENHARRAVELSLAIIKETQKIVLKNGNFLNFKIGVNSGHVTAGVVGFHKPQFSLVGDTVNIASRMASTLTEVNSVQISMDTYKNLENRSGLIFTDCVREVKGKGEMITKLVKINDKSSGNICREVSGFFSSSSKISNQEITKKSEYKRSSLFKTLGVDQTDEFFEKQNSQRFNSIFNIFCKETEPEKKFRIEYLDQFILVQRLGMILSIICDTLLLFAEILYYSFSLTYSSIFRIFILAAGIASTAIFMKLHKKNIKSLKFALALCSKYTLEFILIYINEFTISESKEIASAYFMYKFILINFFSGNFFAKNIYFNFISACLWVSHTLIFSLNLPELSNTLGFITIILFASYTEEKRMRLNTILKNAAEKEVSKTQELLNHMMPQSALTRLEQGNEVIDKLHQVTVMFADIVGFTAWSSERSSREVVKMLSELFTRFDKMCVENNVYKVHTIGDCYVAMGYLNETNRNPAKEAMNIIKFADQLIDLIQETNEKCGFSLEMRIGIHTGEVTAGITGTKIVRYDIYGSDVMIANKMESNGEAGKVAVSETTKDLIDNFNPDIYRFMPGKEVKISSISKTIKLFYSYQVGKNT